jgi:hypothetical protein
LEERIERETERVETIVSGFGSNGRSLRLEGD